MINFVIQHYELMFYGVDIITICSDIINYFAHVVIQFLYYKSMSKLKLEEDKVQQNNIRKQARYVSK